MNNEKKQTSLHEYRQGFTISLLILVTGVMLEWISGGRGVGLPAWPMNLFIAASFAFILYFIHTFYKELTIVKVLSRVPVSLSAIVLFSLLTLLMGLTKQGEAESSRFLNLTGISHLRNSYVFLLSGLYLLTTLGLVILRRIKPLKYRNIGFLLNHFGLWIIVLAGSLGSGDLKRLRVIVNENETVWYGYRADGHPDKLPFMVKLIDFDIDFFPPKLAYIDSKNMTLNKEAEKNLPMLEEGKTLDFGEWQAEVKELILFSKVDSLGNYYASEDTLAYPSAYLKLKNTLTAETKEGWVSCGSAMVAPRFISTDRNYAFAMTQPESRKYSSLLEIITEGSEPDTALLVVNEPVKAGGWNLYQTDYDQRMGKWSSYSVMEAVKDPWLPIIYIGIFMVIAGSLYLFSIGKNPKTLE